MKKLCGNLFVPVFITLESNISGIEMLPKGQKFKRNHRRWTPACEAFLRATLQVVCLRSSRLYYPEMIKQIRIWCLFNKLNGCFKKKDFIVSFTATSFKL